MSCTLQACVASIAQWIIGSRKRLHGLPPSSSRCCRGLLFSAVILCTLSLAATVVAANLYLLVRVGRLVCQRPAIRCVVVAADALAALVAAVVLSVGSFISCRCY
jgi:hypothetical protein